MWRRAAPRGAVTFSQGTSQPEVTHGISLLPHPSPARASHGPNPTGSQRAGSPLMVVSAVSLLEPRRNVEVGTGGASNRHLELSLSGPFVRFCFQSLGCFSHRSIDPSIHPSPPFICPSLSTHPSSPLQTSIRPFIHPAFHPEPLPVP